MMWRSRQQAAGGRQQDAVRILGCLLPAACCLLILTGCAGNRQQRIIQQAVADYHAGHYTSARERLRPLAEETDENFVLNNVRLGSAALAEYELVEAEAAFLRAYEVINAYGVDRGGRTLGAVLVDEKIRVWRGEPFERAMANFYLGLIYYMRADHFNARGAFENALFKLRDYGEGRDKDDQYREVESNFVLAHLMLGRSWQRIGREDMARANFDRVAELRPDLKALADYDRNAAANVLLVIDYAYGPEKMTDFDGSIVGFYPTPAEAGPIPLPQVFINGQTAAVHDVARPTIDLLALAQDRRWQSLDTLRLIRSATGTGLMVAGVHQLNRERYREGLAFMAAGLLMKATSQADVRQWEMLPRTVFVVPLELPPGLHEISVSFSGFYSSRHTWRGLYAPAEGDAAYYIRMTRWSATHDWPPPALRAD